MRKLLLLAVLLGSTLCTGNMAVFAADDWQQAGALAVEMDDRTGAVVEGSFIAKSPLAAAEDVVQLDRFEDLATYVKTQTEQFKDTVQVSYTVASPSGFDAASHSEELKQLLHDVFNDGSYMSGTIAGWGTQYRYSSGQQTQVKLVLTFTYRHTSAQEKELTRQVIEIASDISIAAKTDFDKVIAVNDFITRNYSYSFDTKLTPHSAHTMITEQQGVCQAYALLAQRLLQELGVEAYYQTGEIIGGELHAWNKVKVDGKWYNLDTTWNDPLADRKGQTRYEYLLVSDKVMNESRTADDLGLPAATSTKYDVLHTGSPYTTFGAYDKELVYVSVWKSTVEGQIIKAYNKQTMQQVNSPFKIGRNLVAHNGDIYHFGPYKQTNLYMWNGNRQQVELVDEGTFDQLYKQGNTLYYREAETKNMRELQMSAEDGTQTDQIAATDSLIGELNEFSPDFEKALAAAENRFNQLSAEDKLLVKNSAYLQQMKSLLAQKAAVSVTYQEYKIWMANLTADQPLKEWVITFSGALGDTANAPVSVIDQFGRTVDGITNRTADNKMYVTPSRPYHTGHTYYIVIDENLHSANQVKLKQGVLASFVITN
ncbi:MULTISPECIES: transglutaminase domain-containing protein [Sporosarcina]|uniref:transglutaminase domain-containing protein n=1 Tax=Sporosarcina TaxID=1569 RepID=UPI00129A5771|nr:MULTISPECIES: transglutaminase domain-containing protein [Sporosarcina]GKV65971.1 hypothetical protein NCCP2331_21240 [Sporosarcina sp. NCCP-2331]GLB56029.1 hypothetical protein NCCP2378_18160 [Sporosarcina sp. NCCP-2378]